MMYKLVPLFIATLLSAAAIAGDDKPMKSTDTMFKSLDKNSDERLSQSEVASDSKLSEHFASLDADSDGYLTKREYTAHSKSEKTSRDY